MRFLPVLLLLVFSCATWSATESRWYTQEELDTCEGEKVDPAKWQSPPLKEWQGVPSPEYQKIQSKWYNCHKATLAMARHNKNAVENNKRLYATWIPLVQNVVDTAGYLAILAFVVFVANPPSGLALLATIAAI